MLRKRKAERRRRRLSLNFGLCYKATSSSSIAGHLSLELIPERGYSAERYNWSSLSAKKV
jgi:hypothetical protein